MKAVVKYITLPQDRRTICVSDIHGHLDLLEKLLEKIGYTDKDTLVLLGDLYTKGPRGYDTLRYIIELAQRENVHVLRGNCDWIEDCLSPAETAWLEGLPHILESDGYIFVHGGLPSEDLTDLDAFACAKNDAFIEQGLSFSRWVVTGHWPVNNYCHTIPCFNPIINESQHIIAIDGGCVLNKAGQLNAFIIQNGTFSFDAVDLLPQVQIDSTQTESGGTLHIVWHMRWIDITERGDEFSKVRHQSTGIEIWTPNQFIWEDEGQPVAPNGTDYFLPVNAGETVSLVYDFSDRMLAKKNGVLGWVLK